MSSVHKALLALLGLALLGGLASCLPKPDEPIEWLRREDAVIIQKKSVFPEKFPYPWYEEVDAACGVPEFTLYGDGTLIFRQPEGLDYGGIIFRTLLDQEDVEEILEPIIDDSFFDFGYEQPIPEPTEEVLRYASATTFLYVHTKLAANAVSAYALKTLGAPQGGGKEWDQYRKIGRIADRLNELSLSFGAGDFLTFEPETELLVVQPLGGQPPEEPIAWEGTVSLAEIAPQGSGLVTLELQEGETAGRRRSVTSESIFGGHIVSDGGRVFYFCTRPVLPFEEHFPEFDQPP